jgi:exosortase
MTRAIQLRAVLFLTWCVIVSFGFWANTYRLKDLVSAPSSSQEIFAPLLTMYCIWTDRTAVFCRSKYSPRRAAQIGLLAILALGAAFVGLHAHPLLGYLVTIASAGALIVAGFVGIFGEEALKRAAFPLSLLLIMLPLPNAVIDRVISALQVGSAYLSEQIFALLGVPVFRSGLILSVPGVNIEVARECSGINSTFALLLTMLFVARQSLHTFWRRLALLLVVLPLSIVKNAVRIVTLTLLAVKVDPSFLTGRLHHQGGFVFYLLTLGLVLPIVSLLRRGETSNTRHLVGSAA